MTISISKPLFITDTDTRVNVAILGMTKDSVITVSIKTQSETEYGIIYAKKLLVDEVTDIVLPVAINGLVENTTYLINAAITSSDTTSKTQDVEIITKESYTKRYEANVKAVFTQLTSDGTLYKTMITDMQNELDKYTFDDFEKAQLMAQYMAQITTGMTSEASRTALNLTEKEKTSAKNGELLDKQIEKINKEIELQETQIQTTKESVKHNLLIKLLDNQESYALAMAGSDIIPSEAMHTNFFVGVKEGYRWAGFSYVDSKIYGTDGTELGTFSTTDLTESSS